MIFRKVRYRHLTLDFLEGGREGGGFEKGNSEEGGRKGGKSRGSCFVVLYRHSCAEIIFDGD
jgi:hypothetical protein